MSEGEQATQARFRDCFFDLRDGLRLHYRDYRGSADHPPILCLHGLTRNARDFADFAERYSPRFRVLALDFRGRGDSDYDPVPARYNPLTYAGDVLELLDQLELPEAIFVGTSLGGLVTMTLAAIAPERIAATILNDVGPDLDQAGLDRILTYVGQDVRFASWDEAAQGISASQGELFPDYTLDDWLRKARRLCREREGEIGFDYDMAIAEPFRTAGPAPKVDMWPLFATLGTKPLLVIRGEISDLLSADVIEKMKQAAPNARFALIPRTGHSPELDEPAAIEAIDQFLGQLAG